MMFWHFLLDLKISDMDEWVNSEEDDDDDSDDDGGEKEKKVKSKFTILILSNFFLILRS